MKSKQEKVNVNKGNKNAYGTFTSELWKEVQYSSENYSGLGNREKKSTSLRC
jgi:hypothetical protein